MENLFENLMNAPPFINFPANVGWVFPRANGLFMYHVPSLCYESPLDLFNSYLISAHQLYNSGNYSQAYGKFKYLNSSFTPGMSCNGC